MITQEKMYDMFYNNQELVEFINQKHQDAAITNEQVLKEMLSNDVYAEFLLAKNNKLNKQTILEHLNMHPNYFWLKTEPLNLVLFLKHVKKKQLALTSHKYFFRKTTIISSLLYYLYQLDTKTNASDKVISEIAEIADENINQALKLLIKNGLVK
ncbi:MAG: hypothetical protein IJE91_03280 [Clostridia bacterium]|nr:hypothetical protein [Clostridia bacterium]